MDKSVPCSFTKGSQFCLLHRHRQLTLLRPTRGIVSSMDGAQQPFQNPSNYSAPPSLRPCPLLYTVSATKQSTPKAAFGLPTFSNTWKMETTRFSFLKKKHPGEQKLLYLKRQKPRLLTLVRYEEPLLAKKGNSRPSTVKTHRSDYARKFKLYLIIIVFGLCLQLCLQENIFTKGLWISLETHLRK